MSTTKTKRTLSLVVFAGLLALFTTAGIVSGASVYGSTTSNLTIPDNGGWVNSSITISGAPSGATVTGIDVHFSAVHPYSGDLNVDLNDAGITSNYDLWANEGGSADNPSRTVYGITTFNGLPVNGTWKLFAKDTASGDSGYIDEWWVRIYYTEVSNTYAVYAKIDSLVYGTDADSDGYYETFDFNICVDGDASPGPADVHARMISNTTSQAWWSTNSWSVSGTATDYHCFAFDETDFVGKITGNTNLDFTVELWNVAKSTKLATDTSVTGEPVKVDRANTYAVYGKVDSLAYGTDTDSDGYYETFDFNLCIDGDATPGPTTVYGRLVSVTTSQAWWSASSWSVSGTATDYHCFAFDETDFVGKITGNTNLDFTVELWNAAKSTKLATDTGLTSEPVKADYVSASDTAGPKVGSGIGVLGDTKTHVDTYYDDGILGFFDKYLLEDWSRRSSLNPHGHNGSMQLSAKIETRIFDSDWFVEHDKMEDDDNVWNDTNQRAGVDAQVHAGWIYDYLHQLGLNGPDDMGGSMDSVVEATEEPNGDPCVNNAFWNGEKVAYCIGVGQLSYAGAFDVVGHEWGHAVTDLSGANFAYSGEPGALDEAFSDFLGAAAAAHYSIGSTWLIGDPIRPNGIRNMADPPQLNSSPDTYLGNGWCDSGGCNQNGCCRHTNANVADKMFYLLSEGGTHNDIQVSGLGIQTAMEIALAANRVHWNASSNFSHGREGMVLTAASSNAKAQVRNAWAAVQVGAPAADFFESALTLSGSSGQSRTSNRGATKQTGEPSHAGNSGGKSVWLNWTSPGNGDVSIHTHGSSFDTLLAVYTGSSVASLTPIAANDDDGSANNGSGVTFSTTGAVTYRIAVDGYNGQQGDVVLSYAWTAPPTLTALSIQGPSSANEQSAAVYTATASWGNGSTTTINPSWSENSAYASINSSGVLSTTTVTSNQSVTVTATYSAGGVTKTASKAVTIVNNVQVLTGLAIQGPSSVSEQSAAVYTATASWDNGSITTVNPPWSENSAYTSINSSGVLSTTTVTSNQSVTVTATYSAGGVTKTASKAVTIVNNGTIFSDGFESGDLTRWSASSVP